ncbi:ABC transporter substrate-binding protein [Pseudodesulfovibrio tunisiensis]|uniref:ABC transporter substrate-binding protein n=1 Tax=Pseudodesulfovibrio tunisiensis TaxID=463192 RepID=UPI001FB4F29F|nr:ABC transporter substrate-binding protein [Pseudodesulfovibrio tunisiensis]
MKNRKLMLLTLCLTFLFSVVAFGTAFAHPHPVPQKIRAIMIGDRLVDVALKLGVIPEAMSVRASIWSKGDQLRLATQLLGCPNRVTVKEPETVPNYMKTHGITRVIIERNEKFCLYFPKVKPESAAELVKDIPGVTVEFVDFGQGVAPAIMQTARLLNVEEHGRRVVAEYEKQMAKVEKNMPKGLGKRVLILNGNYSDLSGKGFVRIEAPGGYSDQYILTPLGCRNAADAMISDTMKITKGHVSGGRLRGLAKANPDVIVATGDAFAVQLALKKAIARNPELSQIPAIRNNAVYSLPFYGDSGVLEYPHIFRQWSQALQQ